MLLHWSSENVSTDVPCRSVCVSQQEYEPVCPCMSELRQAAVCTVSHRNRKLLAGAKALCGAAVQRHDQAGSAPVC